jgi:hypothetical protein
VSRDSIVERDTLDQLHDESGGGSRLFDPEKRGDVRMNERRENDSFAPEAGKSLRVERVSLGQNLQRDITAEAGVAGAVDFAHSALARQPDDFEAP